MVFFLSCDGEVLVIGETFEPYEVFAFEGISFKDRCVFLEEKSREVELKMRGNGMIVEVII